MLICCLFHGFYRELDVYSIRIYNPAGRLEGHLSVPIAGVALLLETPSLARQEAVAAAQEVFPAGASLALSLIHI